MQKANIITVIALLLFPAAGLVISDNNITRWIVSLSLIAYPLVVLLMQPLIRRDSIETDRLDYRNYFFSIGFRSKYTHLFILMWFTILFAKMDMGMAYVFFLSSSLSWFFVVFLAGLRHRKRLLNILPVGSTVILIAGFLLMHAFLFFEFGGSEKRISLPVNTNTFHSRFLSILGKTETAIAQSSALNSDKTPGIAEMERAEQNRWFIENYAAEQGWTSAIKPHFSVGSNYATQLSDTLPVRYMVAEHGFLATALPILLLLSLVIFPIRSVSEAHNETTGYSAGNLFSIYFLMQLICFGGIDILINSNAFPFTGISYFIFAVNDLSYTLAFLGTVAIACTLYKRQENANLARWHIRQSFSFLLPLAIFAVIALGFSLIRKTAGNYALETLKSDLVYCSEKLNDGISTRIGSLPLEEQKKFRRLDAPAFYRELISDPEVAALFPEMQQQSPAASDILQKFLNTNTDKNNPTNLLFVEKDRESGWKIKVNEWFFIKASLNNRETLSPAAVLGYTGKHSGPVGGFNYNGISVAAKDVFKSTRSAANVNLLALPAAAFRRLPAEEADNSCVYFAQANVPGAMIDANNGQPESQPYAVRVNERDGFTVEADAKKGDITFFHGGILTDELLARPFWINGKYQYLYPESNHKLYTYMLSHNMKNSAKDAAVQLTLDVHLQKDLDNLLSTVYDSSKVKASITVTDGEANFRAMAQNELYKEDRTDHIQIDPNYFTSLSELFTLTYKLSDANANRLIQRRSLISDGKPGSTIKPFTWAAVIDGFAGRWNELDLMPAGINEQDITKSSEGNESVKFFAGRQVFPISLDEHGSLAAKNFLAFSKNSYHLLINYLGSFEKEQLKATPLASNYRYDAQQTGILVKDNGPSTLQTYPQVRLGSQTYHFNSSLDKWPQNGLDPDKLFGNPQSVMAKGFAQNFHTITNSDSTGARYSRQKWYFENIEDSILVTNNLFTDGLLPQFSTYEEDRRSVKRNDLPGGSYLTFRASQVGAEIYKVSPATLCQMAVSMTKLDRSLKLKFIQQQRATRDTINWIYDQDGYNNAEALYRIRRSTVYESMRLSNAEPGGTAYSIFNAPAQDGVALNKGTMVIDGKTFYLYTKTGTADESDHDTSARRKNLLIIISNREMHTGELKQDKPIRCMALYVQLRNHPTHIWSEQDKAMIRRSITLIARSASFSNYFN
ncbi:hypothetical protein LZZ85_16220 [Terrimonas sp. NA20]|uniref:Uncharacterized protein n=1 Tax=Terrimonas ginsenosidimutans TaxID=2908004 RepID=A0ABS9KU68_9BACT|nr:hypothetical protein [Terrimonas ginsenosidimutans]MCG2615842.1 hypothetical protein [Terrimonas ginsenosidimutans]